MATYAIGDVQGCYASLCALLDVIHFDPVADRVWFVGDLVNRGPRSLETLRLVMGLGDAARVVLGNHDLHLLVRAAGGTRPHRSDTLEEILTAPDRDVLLDWLRLRPLAHYEHGVLMVHAGVLPQWDLATTLALAGEVEHALAAADHVVFLRAMYGNDPDHWNSALGGWDRLRVITNALTRLRVCTAQGNMEFQHKGALARIPPGFMPWFDVPGRRSANVPMLVGHWSALGLRIGPELMALDTGCLWGGNLTALRLEDRRVFQVPAQDPPLPIDA